MPPRSSPHPFPHPEPASRSCASVFPTDSMKEKIWKRREKEIFKTGKEMPQPPPPMRNMPRRSEMLFWNSRSCIRVPTFFCFPTEFPMPESPLSTPRICCAVPGMPSIRSWAAGEVERKGSAAGPSTFRSGLRKGRTTSMRTDGSTSSTPVLKIRIPPPPFSGILMAMTIFPKSRLFRSE